MSQRSIDDVIEELGQVVAWARDHGSRAGYFAALYRRVTLGVRDWIRDGRFDDGPRMERLDVRFADRYLDAWRRWRAGQPTTRSWAVAFDATGTWSPIVLQHLLLGMNAHINLDLGIATAEIARGSNLAPLEGDFRRINDLLASMVDDVEERLASVWPLLRVLDWAGGRTDEATVHFSMRKARQEAWEFAGRLSARPDGEWDGLIRTTDHAVAGLGRLVRHPGPLLGTAIRLVRLGEFRSTEGIIDLLS